MKKIVLLFFILFSISFSSQKYNFKFENVDLLNVEVSKKCHSCRYLEGTLKNKTNKQILILNFEIKYRDKDATENDPYYTIGKIILYNIEPKKTVNFIKSLDVRNIDGEDFKIKLTKIILGE